MGRFKMGRWTMGDIMRNRNNHVTKQVIGGKERKEVDVVWFNSYGKEVQAEKQIIGITEDETMFEGSLTNQAFRIEFIANEECTIELYDEDEEVIDSFTTDAESYPHKYDLVGKLIRPLSKLVVDTSKVSEMKVTLEEVSIAKRDMNYVKDIEGVSAMLQQELSVIKGELWYNVNYGLPLLDKIKSKTVIDSKVLEIVSNNLYVRGILSFSSLINNKTYTCAMEVSTVFGNIYVSV